MWREESQRRELSVKLLFVYIFREAEVKLVCQHDFPYGKDQLTTTGNRDNALHYVSKITIYNNMFQLVLHIYSFLGYFYVLISSQLSYSEVVIKFIQFKNIFTNYLAYQGANFLLEYWFSSCPSDS